MAFSELHTTKLPVRDGVAWYRLDQDLRYSFQLGDQFFAGVVPAGFETDFASIPRILRPVFATDGEYTEAAVMHDWLYGKAHTSRFMADALFREGMKQLGVPVWKRIVIFYAVRIFGGKHYGNR